MMCLHKFILFFVISALFHQYKILGCIFCIEWGRHYLNYMMLYDCVILKCPFACATLSDGLILLHGLQCLLLQILVPLFASLYSEWCFVLIILCLMLGICLKASIGVCWNIPFIFSSSVMLGFSCLIVILILSRAGFHVMWLLEEHGYLFFFLFVLYKIYSLGFQCTVYACTVSFVLYPYKTIYGQICMLNKHTYSISKYNYLAMRIQTQKWQKHVGNILPSTSIIQSSETLSPGHFKCTILCACFSRDQIIEHSI